MIYPLRHGKEAIGFRVHRHTFRCHEKISYDMTCTKNMVDVNILSNVRMWHDDAVLRLPNSANDVTRQPL